MPNKAKVASEVIKECETLNEMAVKYGGWTSRDKPIDEELRFCSCIHDVQN